MPTGKRGRRLGDDGSLPVRGRWRRNDLRDWCCCQFDEEETSVTRQRSPAVFRPIAALRRCLVGGPAAGWLAAAGAELRRILSRKREEQADDDAPTKDPESHCWLLSVEQDPSSKGCQPMLLAWPPLQTHRDQRVPLRPSKIVHSAKTGDTRQRGQTDHRLALQHQGDGDDQCSKSTGRPAPDQSWRGTVRKLPHLEGAGATDGSHGSLLYRCKSHLKSCRTQFLALRSPRWAGVGFWAAAETPASPRRHARHRSRWPGRRAQAHSFRLPSHPSRSQRSCRPRRPA